jgi:DNA polymerase III delta subunit
MIIVITGDRSLAMAKALAIVEKQKEKDPFAMHARLDKDSFSSSAFLEAWNASGLFQGKVIVLLDSIEPDKDEEKVLKDAIGEGREGAILVSVCGVYSPAFSKALAAKADKTEDVAPKVKPQKKEDVSLFPIADAFGARDRKLLWTLYVKAILGGSAPDEIQRILWWQARSMMLARAAVGPSESGLSPFVHGKSAKYARNYPGADLTRAAQSLITALHESRQGGDLGLLLEKFCLGV